MLFRLLLLVSLPLASIQLAGAAPVYKWIDAAGNVHYSDQPLSADSRVVKLPELTTYSARPLPQTLEADQPHEPASGSTDSVPPALTHDIQILRPRQFDEIASPDGTIMVRFNSVPSLSASQIVRLELDGVLLPEQHRTRAIGLTGLDFGTHSLAVVIFDEAGGQLARSDPRTFSIVPPRLPTAAVPAAQP
jgi:hypothetical protein